MHALTLVLLVILALAIVVMFVVIVWRMKHQPQPTQYGSNPDPAHITDEMWWLWQQLQALEPSSKLGGIYANKAGYHNTRRNLPSYDYSVCDDPPDQGGPSDAAAAIDWTFPDAQGGNYATISKYTKRLLLSAQDPDDPRLNGWREFYGNADSDSYVEGWDCRYNCAATSDSSHLWHLHISENRDQTTSRKNKEALLSVLRNETVAQWLGGAQSGGVVLLNCPYDKARQDFFWVDEKGAVRHKWFTGSLNTLWSGGGSSENLGGKVVPGTLSATWSSDESEIDLAALGEPDANAPANAGQYWGFTLNRSGARSGWGSFEKCYGGYPAALPPTTYGVDRTSRYLMAALVVAVLLVALTILTTVVVG